MAIRGTIYEGNPHFVDSFNDFLMQVKKCAVTFSILPDPDSAQGSRCFPLFNESSSVLNYQTTLRDLFERVKIDIHNEILRDEPNAIKIFQLDNYRLDLRAARTFLTFNDSGFHHEGFTVNLISDKCPPCPEVTEKDFQEYFSVLNSLAEKCSFFLEDMIDVLAKSSEQTFKKHISQKQIEADLKPLKFFDRFFANGGIVGLKNKFLLFGKELDYVDVDYDDESEVRTIKTLEIRGNDFESWQEWEVRSTKTFSDYIDEVCSEGLEEMKGLLKDYIQGLESIDKVKKYFVLLFDSLKKIKTVFAANAQICNYNSLLNLPDQFGEWVRKFYPGFFNEVDDLTSDSVNNRIGRTISISATKETIGDRPIVTPSLFNWAAANPEELTRILYSELNGDFIDYTDYSVFERAFSIKPADKALQIKWVDSRKEGLINHSTLIYLFKRLYQAGLLEGDMSDHLYEKLKFTFLQGDGSEIGRQKLYSAMNQLNGLKVPTRRHLRINAIVAKLTDAKKSE